MSDGSTKERIKRRVAQIVMTFVGRRVSQEVVDEIAATLNADAELTALLNQEMAETVLAELAAASTQPPSVC